MDETINFTDELMENLENFEVEEIGEELQQTEETTIDENIEEVEETEVEENTSEVVNFFEFDYTYLNQIIENQNLIIENQNTLIELNGNISNISRNTDGLLQYSFLIGITLFIGIVIYKFLKFLL